MARIRFFILFIFVYFYFFLIQFISIYFLCFFYRERRKKKKKVIDIFRGICGPWDGKTKNVVAGKLERKGVGERNKQTLTWER